MTLDAYLASAASSAFDWASRNCMLWVAEWVILRTGRDPAADLRGRGNSRRGWMCIVARYGGVAEVASIRMDRLGLPRTDEPKAGDVGLVQAVTPDGPSVVAAIFTGLRWAALAPGGLISVRATPLVAWSLVAQAAEGDSAMEMP